MSPASSLLTFEESPRRVRTLFAGETIADSTAAMLLHEPGRSPVYYLPFEDARIDLLVPSALRTTCPHKGAARYWSIRVGERAATDTVWNYPEPIAGCPDIAGHVAFVWDAMDAWFEEDEEVFGHARSPYHRVDVLDSSLHVLVELEGTQLAETLRPRLLFETGLPTRYYLPKVDVRTELLVPSATRTRCPYKGEAHYWSAIVDGESHVDVAWSYPLAISECPKIEGLVAFDDVRVELRADGGQHGR